MTITEAQRQALQDFVLLSQASELLDRKAELMWMRVPRDPRVDEVQATSADVHDAADKALDKVLEEFGA